MNEGRFLHGKALSEKVKEVCSGEEVRCAVAFLGERVRHQLFPNGIGSAQIMCDISMGCTSRRALKDYGAPTSARATGNDLLKVYDGLHGKLYISSKGAVIGSPNMSTRGLGRTLQGDWNLEIGVFCHPGSLAWKQAREWFDSEFENRLSVTWRDVERAADVDRDPGRLGRADELSPSLLTRVFDDPSAYDGILFVITSGTIPQLIDSARTNLHSRQSKRGLHTDIERESVVHDEPEVLSGRFNHVVVYFLPEEESDQELEAYIDIVPVPFDRADTLFGVANWRQAWKGRTGPAPSKARAFKADRATALKLLGAEGDFVGIASELKLVLEKIGFESKRSDRF